MRLIDFLNHIHSLDDNSIFEYALSDPFYLDGNEAECAFSITQNKSTKDQVLLKIYQAIVALNISQETLVNFEDNSSSFTDGKYEYNMIKKIESDKQYPSLTHKLISLAFS